MTSTTSRSWPPGLPRTLHYPNVGVGAILAGSARRFGDRVAFAHGERELSYAQLWRTACQFAQALRARGIGRGDTVAIHLPNCLGYPVAYYGIQLAGATFSPANPLLPPAQLATQLVDAGAVAAVSHGQVANALTSVRTQTPTRLVIVYEPTTELDSSCVDFADFGAGDPHQPPEVCPDPRADVAHLAYTGGTTGRAKGVRLPHRNVVVNALQYACWGTGSVPATDDAGNLWLNQIGDQHEWPTRHGTGVSINLTPWFHAMGTIGGLNVPVLTGTSVVLHDRLDPPAYLADAERLRITSIGGAPALFAALLACDDIHTRDLTSVRTLTSGAAPLATEMINQLRRVFPEAAICEGYGLTEVTMGATTAPQHRSGLRKIGSVGVPVFDTEVKIVPGDGGEDALPAGTEGEVCVRGPQVMAGYHARDAETDQVLVNGWLHTGDIGMLDEDGYLSIVDRKKDMLIYKGYNVYPRELEELLAAHPAVATAAVVGKPDGTVGELPYAFVVRALGQDIGAAQLMDEINEQVLPYKRLRGTEFVNEVPVSAAGKVLRRQLRERLT